ncbi:MAG: GH92 family glycosyl hydrolase [Clostridia bacterium]|nr:GH92 family glycosyl hydrolase [Clostridia bacterium]
MPGQSKSPYDYVNPLIDTAKPNPRWVFFQSASMPFGMVQLSPDTDTDGTWGVGYRYNSPRIKCFSHMHSWQLGAIPVLPFSGEFNEGIKDGYFYSHESESVRPGYHKIILEECGITAELTATKRVGIHRYTFQPGHGRALMIDLGKTLGPSSMSAGKLEMVSGSAIEGFTENAPTIRRPRECRIYYHMEFSAQIKEMVEKEGNCFSLYFEDHNSREVIVKTALSFVSAEQAAKNMMAEVCHWDFDRVVSESRIEWDKFLGRIEVRGGKEQEKIKFYTDLWRTSFGGHIINDIDGKYCDMTGGKPVIRQIPIDENGNPEHQFLSNADIFWGAHWSLGLLWDIAYPDIKNDYCRSLVEMYRNGGLIPRGPSGGNYTFVMIAAHSGAFISSAYMKGIRNFDIEAAYEGIRKNAFPGGLMSKSGYEHGSCLDGGIEFFIERGYIPERERKSPGYHCDGAAQTLEYSYDHWCIAMLAKSLGKYGDHELFLERSGNYRNLFDSGTGFMRPRNEDGSFIEPYDPLSLKGFCEGNGWGYTFYVPHDIPGLIELMGGRRAFIDKLNHAFQMAGEMNYYAGKPELHRDRAFINYGNENTRFTVSLFNHAGACGLSQKWSRKVRQALFSSTGLCGFCEDDDCGLSAGTSILLAIGLFDLKGGAYEKPLYEIGSPIFDEIIISLDQKYYTGDEFRIIMKNNSPDRPYVDSAMFNGKHLVDSRIYHDDLAGGGTLVLQMTDKEPELE